MAKERDPFRVVLISHGKLNGLILKLLARTPGIGEIAVATRDPDRIAPAINLARMSAGAEGFFPVIRAVRFDLNRTAPAAETLRALQPDVTFAAPSFQSWWKLDHIPKRASRRLRPAGFGAWLPFQLAPMLKLMKAWKLSELATPIIGAPYPDVVHPILSARGLAPTCGVGNVDEIVPKLRWRASREIGVPPEKIRVWLAAHHALERHAYRSEEGDDEAPPFLLRIEADGRRLSGEDAPRAWLLEACPIPQDLDFHFLTAGSAVRLVAAFNDSKRTNLVHVPGPGGLPGGYPVRIRRGTVELDLPEDWTLEEAIAVNRASHRWDGIEAIDPDGTFTYSPRTARVLRRVLGFDRSRVELDAVEDAAQELARRFDRYMKRFRD